jgi:tetratricopeptide (TPR) repeat protein
LALQDKNLTEAQAALTRFVQLRQAANSANKAGAEDDRGLAQAYFLLSGIAEQNQQPDEAERYLALIESPQDAIRVRARRAAILARQGKLDEARALIRAAPESVEEDARAKISAESQLLRDNKQFALVYAFLQEVVKTHPDDVDLRYDLAMAAEKLDKLDEMEKLLRQVIAEKPEYHHAYNALGYSLADRKLRLPEARELVRKALEFAPTDPFIQDSLGWVEFRSGNLSAAAQILQGAYQSRQDAEIAAHLGEVLWSMGQQEQARAVWKAGLSQNPDNDTLLETIKRLGPL